MYLENQRSQNFEGLALSQGLTAGFPPKRILMEVRMIKTKFYKIFFCLCLIIIIAFPMPLLSADCDYDTSWIDKSYFLKTTKFSDAVWDSKRKEAKIFLNNNERIIVRYGGCVHFGVGADYILNIKNISPDLLKNKIKWFASKLLEFNDDFKLFSNALDDKQFNQDLKKIPSILVKEPISLYVQDSTYSSLICTISLDKGRYVVNISFYE